MRSIFILSVGAALTLALRFRRSGFQGAACPTPNTGEIAIEPLGDYGHDPNRAHSGELSTVSTIRIRGQRLLAHRARARARIRDAVPDNHSDSVRSLRRTIFQFTERGQYWLDAGLFAEFGKATLRGNPNEFTFGPMFRKEIFGTINTVNLLIQKEVGPNSSQPTVLRVCVGNASRPRHADRAGL